MMLQVVYHKLEIEVLMHQNGNVKQLIVKQEMKNLLKNVLMIVYGLKPIMHLAV